MAPKSAGSMGNSSGALPRTLQKGPRCVISTQARHAKCCRASTKPKCLCVVAGMGEVRKQYLPQWFQSAGKSQHEQAVTRKTRSKMRRSVLSLYAIRSMWPFLHGTMLFGSVQRPGRRAHMKRDQMANAVDYRQMERPTSRPTCQGFRSRNCDGYSSETGARGSILPSRWRRRR